MPEAENTLVSAWGNPPFLSPNMSFYDGCSPPFGAGSAAPTMAASAHMAQIGRLPARRAPGNRSGDNPHVIDNRSTYRSFSRYNLIDK